MNAPLRILYVGALWEGSTSLQRMNAMLDLSHQVTALDSDPPSVRQARRSLRHRIGGKLFRMGFDAAPAPDLARVNDSILQACSTPAWDVLWMDKGMAVERKTLQQIRSCGAVRVIAGYSPDDMAARHNQSRQFLEHLPEYDIFFTTKSYGVAELKALGCKRVEFIGNAFDPHMHTPAPVPETDRTLLGGSVGFIGAWEHNRADDLLNLARSGVDVRVWGPGWQNCKSTHASLRLEKRALWGLEYARAVRAFAINLCFLRKMNRDLQTTRSVEIPACEAFMLAERTAEHRALFEEGREAEFFDSPAELLEKVQYYLAHPGKRCEIAAAGRQRCIRSGYSNPERIQSMLETIRQINP